MSIRDRMTPQDFRPDRLNPVSGTPILRASVEATRLNDLCTSAEPPTGARERILAWLAEGAREVSWALCALPRERWASVPPERLGAWPALRHARHIALREAHLTLPTVRHVLGETADAPPSAADLEHADAAWDAAAAIESAQDIV